MPSSHIRLGIMCLLPLNSPLLVVAECLVFTIKYHPDGIVDKYKARSVARGFTQTYEANYLETSLLPALTPFMSYSFWLSTTYGWCPVGWKKFLLVRWPWERCLYGATSRICCLRRECCSRGRRWCVSLKRKYMVLSKAHEPGLVSSVASSVKVVS